MRAALAIALLLAAPAGATSLASLTSKAPVAELASPRSALALEMCIGLRADWWGVPAVLRGERETLISVGHSRGAMVAYRVTDRSSQRRVAVFAGPAWDARAVAVARACS